jgi:hypothetical protein
LAILRQFLAARSIVEAAIRPTQHLTELASLRLSKSIEAITARHFFSDFHLPAASPHPYVRTGPIGRSRSGMAKT